MSYPRGSYLYELCCMLTNLQLFSIIYNIRQQIWYISQAVNVIYHSHSQYNISFIIPLRQSILYTGVPMQAISLTNKQLFNLLLCLGLLNNHLFKLLSGKLFHWYHYICILLLIFFSQPMGSSFFHIA